MKILFVLDTYPPHVNGAAKAMHTLAVNLVKRGHQVFVVTSSTTFRAKVSHENGMVVYRLRSVPVMLEKVQKFRLSPKPLHIKKLKRIIEEIHPDIIHINEPLPLGLSAIQISKQYHIPLIIGHHFMPENLVHFLHLSRKLETVVTRRIWEWYADVCNQASLVISPTKLAEDILLQYSTSFPHVVISNGVELGRFRPTNDGSHLVKKYNFPTKNVLLYVGRLDKEKNIDVLIKAIALCREKIDVHAIIVGQGKERESLEALAKELHVEGQITFTGYLPEEDLPNIYRVADIFVMPSIAELQSLVTMEAMACGLPVIGANAVALPHLIHNGENGYLFEPGNERELSEKIVLLLTDEGLRKKMAERSLQIIQEHEMGHVIANLEQAYSDAIAKYKIPTEDDIRETRRVTQHTFRSKLLPRLKRITASVI